MEYSPIHTTGKSVGLNMCRKKSVHGGYVLGVEWVREYAVEK